MSPENGPKSFGTFEKQGLFLKSPEYIIPFISSPARGSQLSSFAVLLVCLTLKNMLKDQLFKTSGLQFDNWLFGSEKFSGHSTNRPQASSLLASSRRACHISMLPCETGAR